MSKKWAVNKATFSDLFFPLTSNQHNSVFLFEIADMLSGLLSSTLIKYHITTLIWGVFLNSELQIKHIYSVSTYKVEVSIQA